MSNECQQMHMRGPKKSEVKKRKKITNHVSFEVFLFLKLKTLQVFQHASAGVFDVLFGDFERLLELIAKAR